MDEVNDGVAEMGQEMGQAGSPHHNEGQDYDYLDPWEKRRKEIQKDADRLRMRPEDLDVFLRAKFELNSIPRDAFTRRNMLAYLRKHQVAPPRWVLISGLMEGEEFVGEDRRGRLRNLHKTVVLLTRRELLRQANDPLKGERSAYWEPELDVCLALTIAPSKLSKLMKDFSGCNLVQTFDVVRAEGLKGRLKREMRARSASFEGDRWTVLRAVRKARRDDGVTLDDWAREMGFANYRRMGFACVAAFNKSLQRLELEVIDEIVKGVEDEVVKVWTDKELRELIWGIEAYQVILNRELDERLGAVKTE